MNYEEKYKIAFKRFKAWREKYLTKETAFGDVIYDKTGEMQAEFNAIFPELTESEDERIRVVILKLVIGMRDEIFTTADKLVTKPKVLAWLEKQKEPIDPFDDEQFCRGYYSGVADAYREINEKARELHEKIEKIDWDSLKHDIKITTNDSSDTSGLKAENKSLDEINKENLAEQKPVEWSDEDEKVIEAACALLCEYAGYYKEKDMEAKNLQLFKVSQRLKSLRPQKQENPITPEMMGKAADEALGYAQCDDNRFWIISRAKQDILSKTNIESSPEEMKVLDNILFRAWQMGWLSKYDVIVPVLKQELPADTRWKPSEEQMEALKETIDFAPDTFKPKSTLESLYNDLKKL